MKIGISNNQMESVSKGGLYEANFTGYEVLEESKYGRLVRFYFTVVDNGSPKTVSGLAKYYNNINPKTKLYKWLCAIAGVDMLQEGEFDLDLLINKPVQVMISNRFFNGNVYSNVSEVIADGNAKIKEGDM